jgi:hypothetical protein
MTLCPPGCEPLREEKSRRQQKRAAPAVATSRAGNKRGRTGARRGPLPTAFPGSEQSETDAASGITARRAGEARLPTARAHGRAPKGRRRFEQPRERSIARLDRANRPSHRSAARSACSGRSRTSARRCAVESPGRARFSDGEENDRDSRQHPDHCGDDARSAGSADYPGEGSRHEDD